MPRGRVRHGTRLTGRYLMPRPGRQWAEQGGKHKDPEREPRRRRRAAYNRYGGVHHLFAGHKEQGSMIRRYILWRNHHAGDRRLRAVSSTGQTLLDAALARCDDTKPSPSP
ncbi:hypothetical protein FNJ62_22055 [Streptomyces benahoarensis]|uniref:Transposase n=1 Tax=Streptomyces benahoarensis TaxID=2595054 RepID=A0A553Z872_9ACTN|nr:hypothetical protein FNJ62_22055 [Streptomyces benahoarensis]TSB37636.1 hypothetical protein FNZ23_18295 [Streptomyces benahoarensis]